jgi:hypothetical protein
VRVSGEPACFDLADPSAVAHFGERGWLLTRALDAEGVANLRQWVGEVASWPEGAGEWLHYMEMTDAGPRLCRTENFVPFHADLRALLTAGALLEQAAMLLGQPAVLYKEKINYKLPGGAGYLAHQDAPAYRFVETHVSCMLAIDDAVADNGCLEVASAMHRDILPMDESGCVRKEVAARLEWTPVEVASGQALWFHSRAPHRSGANRSFVSRRALYPTYNAAAEGDLRASYYEQKLAEFAEQGRSDRVQVSLIGDFQGRPVT